MNRRTLAAGSQRNWFSYLSIENPLAREILEGRFAAGDAILVNYGKAGIVFEKAAAKPKKVA